jgi:Concanavalin A-like lectin/glucanases superfamily/Galactose oxidase, central domain
MIARRVGPLPLSPALLALAWLQDGPAPPERAPGFAGLDRAALVRAGLLGPDERIVAHAWEGQGRVPWTHAQPERLDFGPRGRTPSTLLLLRGEGELAAELAAEAPRWSLAGGAPARGAGRFGAGLELAAGAHLRLASAEPLAAPALTLELWLRPRDGASGPLLALPGLLALERRPGGTLRLALERAPEPVTSARALEAGRWQHVALVVDPDLLAVRLLVEGEASSAWLPAGATLAPLQRVELGGGGLAFDLDELRLSARAANTAELLEARAPVARTLERLALTTSQGTRTVEVWTRCATSTELDGPAGWAQGELEHVVADAQGLRWVPGHWRRVPALDPPLARTCHPTVYVGDGRVLVFSGEVRDSHLPPMRNVADTWLFDARAERWERLAPALAPPGRCHQQAAFSPDHGLVLLALGWANGPGQDELFGDTWVFHVGARRWEERQPGGSALKKGNERALVYHPGLRRFLLFNGQRVAAYDPDEDAWSTGRYPVVDEQGLVLEHAVPHGLTGGVDPESGAVLLFGGQHARPADSFSGDTLLYEPERGRFVRLEPPEAPSPRVRPGFALDTRRRRFVLFGGVLGQFSQRMDDLWSFDPATRRWTRQEAAGTPSRRGGFMHMAYEPELDRFFLLGGRHAPERFLEEAWSLRLDERAVGRARFAFDRGAAPQGEWFHAGEAPGDARLVFRFRASADGLGWGAWSEEAPRAARYCEVEVSFVPGSRGERPVLRAMGFR